MEVGIEQELASSSSQAAAGKKGESAMTVCQYKGYGRGPESVG